MVTDTIITLRAGTSIRMTGIDMGVTDCSAPAGAALLPLLWLASPALPVGGFSYSEGLEAAVEAGSVRDEASAASWLADQLH